MPDYTVMKAALLSLSRLVADLEAKRRARQRQPPPRAPRGRPRPDPGGRERGGGEHAERRSERPGGVYRGRGEEIADVVVSLAGAGLVRPRRRRLERDGGPFP